MAHVSIHVDDEWLRILSARVSGYSPEHTVLSVLRLAKEQAVRDALDYNDQHGSHLPMEEAAEAVASEHRSEALQRIREMSAEGVFDQGATPPRDTAPPRTLPS
ncbi:hypothetical protein [Streptomyces sp. BRA346]|uniref:hypothetical protein n=1 Tax=Streptomyces sp. BRA346 TaxID=2878199 RepID=UPI0040630C34